MIGDLMVDIATTKKLVEVSLKNGKSYIGIPIYWNNTVGKHIVLIPYWSGYRRDETRELVVTTHYFPTVVEHHDEDGPLLGKDFRLVIPSSEIVSARPFVPNLYKRFSKTPKTE